MLPWLCPTFDTPAEAWPYFDEFTTIEVEHDELKALAEAYITADCVFEEETTDAEGSGYDYAHTIGTCAYADVEVRLETRDTWDWDPSFTSTSNLWDLEVHVASGEGWTRLHVEGSSNSSESGWAWDGSSLISADWDGSIAGYPDDGQIWEEGSTSNYASLTSQRYVVVTPDCTMEKVDVDNGDFYYSLTANDHVAEVAALWQPDCTELTSSVDDVQFGAWDRYWVDDPTDADSDGILPPCDCDDADATIATIEGRGCDDWDGDGFEDDDCDDADVTVAPGARETGGDGIDQDCDGHDDVDADGDGYTADGDDRVLDCDDTLATAYPGADDLGGDGVDQDCDGHDDIDADGDGYTTDGDDAAADCDDADPAIHPGAVEISDDGIDQDCDGHSAVNTDMDEDLHSALAYGGDDCDDSDASIHPGADETMCDGVDSDCDGNAECFTEDPPPAPADGCGCGAPASSGSLLPFALAALARRRVRR